MATRFLVFLFLLGIVQPLSQAQNAPPVAAVPGQSPTVAPSFAEYDAGAAPQIGLQAAKFRWWAPANVKVRGVLVLLPGRGGDGRGMAGNPTWQALATKIQFGIVACFLQNPQDNPFQYQGDPNGAISALIDKSVNAILAQNKVPLKDPPLVFWGHSAGGNVTQNYCSRHPDRVVAAVLARCPGGPGGLAPGKDNVPTLILVGKKDKPEWVSESLANYEKGHAVHATWTLALNPNEGHEVGNTQALASAHIAAAVAARLPVPMFASESVKPKRLARESGWLGDSATYEIASYPSFSGKKTSATWLLDETTAKAWQTYLRGGQ